ncbi:hypothetical protein F2Q70_00016789 [Brassica cretica]|uniref:Retrotransposon gag domain-containing protein n=1 Tax=Brassica cretica TaxID=69181 RepID=A0A8S9I2I0_BRACR|nr:hypothetical protein F2Q70_00016789 [Brassica cretica]
MYPCKTMEDVLSRAWEHVKLEEDVASRARLKPNRIRSPLDQTGETEMKDPPKRDPRTPEAGTGAELVNKLRQMVQQVKWPPNMKAPDSFRNPGLWCDFHRDHGHKTEDCVTLKIEVNELRQKGHLQEFLSEKAKAHLSKESLGKSKGDAPSSPPRQNRVIHVISGGSEVSGVSHAAAKKSTRVNNRGNSGTLCIVRTLHPKSFQRAYVDHSAWSPLKTCKAAPARKIWSPQDPRPPPHIDKIGRSFNNYQPAIS